MKKNFTEIEIPFGVKDSELYQFTYTIPDGYSAEIKDGKVIVKKKESEDERIRRKLLKALKECGFTHFNDELTVKEVIAYLERQKEHKLPDPEYCGENKRYPTEYCLVQDTRKKLIALVEKFSQEEDKEEMLDYLETYQPVQSASEVKEFNFQPGDPDEKAIKRLKAMIYFAFDETSEVPMDEACALDDWLDEKCKPVEWNDSVAKEMFIKALERAVEQTKKGYELTDCDKHSWWEDFKAYSGINPAEWSEEDERMVEIAEECATNKDFVFETLEKQLSFLDWLKSLRPKPHWKPSKKQMWALEWKINNTPVHAWQRKELESLYNDLQKLP